MLALLQYADVFLVGRLNASGSGRYAAIAVVAKTLVYVAIVLSYYLLPEASHRAPRRRPRAPPARRRPRPLRGAVRVAATPSRPSPRGRCSRSSTPTRLLGASGSLALLVARDGRCSASRSSSPRTCSRAACASPRPGSCSARRLAFWLVSTAHGAWHHDGAARPRGPARDRRRAGRDDRRGPRVAGTPLGSIADSRARDGVVDPMATEAATLEALVAALDDPRGPDRRVARPRRPRGRRLRAARRPRRHASGRPRASTSSCGPPWSRARRARSTRHGYRVVRWGGRYQVFPQVVSEAYRFRARHPDAVVDVWNGMPFFSPVWFHGPRLAVLHHVHGEMWRMTLKPAYAAVGDAIERHLAPLAVPHDADRHAVGLLARRDRRAAAGCPRAASTSSSPASTRATRRAGGAAPSPLVVAVGRLVPVKRYDVLFARARRGPGGRPDAALRSSSARATSGRGSRACAASSARRAGSSCAAASTTRALLALYRSAWLVASVLAARGVGDDAHRGGGVRDAGGRDRHRRAPRRGRRRRDGPARRRRRPTSARRSRRSSPTTSCARGSAVRRGRAPSGSPGRGPPRRSPLLDAGP